MEEGQSKKTTPSAKNKQESGHLMLESLLKLLKCPVCWAILELDTLIQCQMDTVDAALALVDLGPALFVGLSLSLRSGLLTLTQLNKLNKN